MMQAVPIRCLGSGYVAVMGTALAVVGVGVTAVSKGALSLLATLVFIAFLLPLTAFRKMLTPTVSATVTMLITATLMSSAFGLLTDVPGGTLSPAAPLFTILALLVMLVATLKGTPSVPLRSPVTVRCRSQAGSSPAHILASRQRCIHHEKASIVGELPKDQGPFGLFGIVFSSGE